MRSFSIILGHKDWRLDAGAGDRNYFQVRSMIFQYVSIIFNMFHDFSFLFGFCSGMFWIVLDCSGSIFGSIVFYEMVALFR